MIMHAETAIETAEILKWNLQKCLPELESEAAIMIVHYNLQHVASEADETRINFKTSTENLEMVHCNANYAQMSL